MSKLTRQTLYQISIIFITVINFFVPWVGSAYLHKPHKSSNIHPEVQGSAESGGNRIRRSIPDWDAVNPSYAYAESQPFFQDSENHQEKVKPYVFADQANSAIRSNTNVKDTLHGRTSQDESRRGGLSSDEQEECYRQQNIEPPSEGQGERFSRKSQHPGFEVSAASNSYDARGRPRRPFGKTGDAHRVPPEEVMSLYSDPVKIFATKENTENEIKQKHGNGQYEEESPNQTNEQYGKKDAPNRTPSSKKIERPAFQEKRSESMSNRKVYKPAKLEATFPIYDEDIEFRPDPLQGILDDRYWENQQDQAGVIKKYVDLAYNNMVPYGADLVKRSADKSGYKDREEKCCCDQIVACKDCRRGKQEENQEQKTTTSKAKLNGNRQKRFKVISEVNESNDSLNRKLVPLDSEVYEDNDYSSNNDVSHSNYIGRKLLSLDDTESEYGDIEDEDCEAKTIIYNNEQFKREQPQIHKDRVTGYDDYYKQEFENSPTDNFPSQDLIAPKKNTHHQVSNKSKWYLGSNEALKGNSSLLQNSFFGIPTQNPGYYESNKLANMMQRARQEKPKGPQKKINPDEEFESVQKQMFQNASVLESSIPQKSKSRTKVDSDRQYYFQNKKFGRRSSGELLPDLNPHSLSHLYQAFDDSKIDSFNNQNNTLVNQTSTVIDTTAVLFNTSENNRNFSSTLPTTYSTPKTHSENKQKADENSIDAEIANDIVETVIIKSQKDSVLGHNMGLSRRNESLMKVKYGKIVPETEKIVSAILGCIMDKVKDHLAKQSCIILDAELLDFLKWMVLSGQSYRDYSRKDEVFGKGDEFGFETNDLNQNQKSDKTNHIGTTCVPINNSESSRNFELDDPIGLEIGNDNSNNFPIIK